MMISTKGRYALRLMIDIARQGDPGVLVTMRQAAEREGLSVKYLEQLGGALVRAGLLKSIRGVNGGYYLACPASDIRISDILAATEGSAAPVKCVDHPEGCERNATCAARCFWVGMRDAIHEYASGVTLADLVSLKLPREEGGSGAPGIQ